tara:strand:+ start:805 stop:1515 length:711 start_codon:yes stop_codon:yes gene_type:complete
MNIVQFLFFTLARKLPDELIMIILFKFRAIQHPLVSQLLKRTENKLCEGNCSSDTGRIINTVYESLLKENQGKKVDIYEIMKQHFSSHIYKESNDPYFKMYPRLPDYGYYIKRPFGKLNYSIKHDYKNVDTSSNLNLFGLTRAKKIIEKYTCKCDYKLKFYYNVNKREVKIYAKRNSPINYDSVTKDLVYLEKTFNLPNFVCAYCKMDKGRYILYHTNIELTKGYRNKHCFNKSQV